MSQSSSEQPPIRQIGEGQSRESGGVAIGSILTAVLAICLCVGLPVLLLLPGINAARESSRRGYCGQYMRHLGLAVANYESVHKRFPTASSGTAGLRMAQTAGGAGDVPAASDGFSWIYQVLPYLENPYVENIERKLPLDVMQLKLADDPSQTGPFDPDFVDDAGQPFAATGIGVFRCATYSGPKTTRLGNVDAATGNYVAIAATDLSAPGASAHKTKTANWENGTIVSRCWKTRGTSTNLGDCQDDGVTLRDFGDGISKTIIACESRETKFNAWISGASMWVVAASPNSLASDSASIGFANDGYMGVLQNGAELTEGGVGLAMNFGDPSRTAAATAKYFQASDWATGVDRAWGPSSEHAGGVVMHIYADAHVQAISREVNPTAYLRFISRNAGDMPTGCSIE